MGLLSILRKIKEREGEMRILMLGLDNAGKTTIVKWLDGGDVHSASPTLGFEIKSMHFEGHRLNIWDVGGQESIRSYWRNYFEQTDGLVWVVDSADTMRLELCRKELRVLLKEEKLAGASLLVLANKQDVPHALSCSEIEEILGLHDMDKDRHWHIAACSAYESKQEKLTAGFVWLVEDIRDRVFRLQPTWKD